MLVAIGAWPWGAYLGAEAIEKGIRVKTSSFTHHHPNITMCNAKAVEKGQRLATGGYDVSHGTNVIGLRPDGTAPYVWTQSTTPGGLADDIRAILSGKVQAQ